jgi:hypothetical protein
MAAFVAMCISDGAFADSDRPHQTHAVSRLNQVTLKKKAALTRALATDPYADPGAPY